MRFDLVLVVALSFVAALCLEARAEATYLSCAGTTRTIRAGGASPEEQLIFSLSVDMERKTVTVNDYEPVPLLGDDTSKNLIVFMPSPPTSFGVSAVTLHRVTGEASIHIIKNTGLEVVNGICKPARRLF